MNSFSDLISAWATAALLAEDLGVPYPTVAAWRQRNSIPAEHWRRIVEKAAQRGIAGVSLELLAEMAEGKASPRDPSSKNPDSTVLNVDADGEPDEVGKAA